MRKLLNVLLLGLCLLFVSSQVHARGTPLNPQHFGINIEKAHQAQIHVFQALTINPFGPNPLAGLPSYNGFDFVQVPVYYVPLTIGKVSKAFKQNPCFTYYPKLC